MSAAAAQLLVRVVDAETAALKVTAMMVTLDEPVSFNVTVRLLPLIRLMPLKPSRQPAY